MKKQVLPKSVDFMCAYRPAHTGPMGFNRGISIGFSIIIFGHFSDFALKSSWKAPNGVITGDKYSQTPYGDFWTNSGRFSFSEKRSRNMKHPEATIPNFLAHSGSVRNLATGGE